MPHLIAPGLDFHEFLAALVARHPVETRLLLDGTHVSPESAAAGRGPNSWAVRLFGDAAVADHREFDRAALGLKCFFDVLQGNRLAFPLSHAVFTRLQAWTTARVQTAEDLDAWSWAILFNDLGKTTFVAARHQALYGALAADHDAQFLSVLTREPDAFPGFLDLSIRHQDALIAGFMSGFNLGKAFALEGPALTWAPLKRLTPLARALHLGHGLFDIFGATGAHDPEQVSPDILNDGTVSALLDLIKNPDFDAYVARVLARHPVDQNLRAPWFARLLALARCATAPETENMCNAWDALPPQVQAILQRELSYTGADGKAPALELHYAPAVFANAGGQGQPVQGTPYIRVLYDLAHVLFKARNMVGFTGNGVVVLNLAELARAVAVDGHDALNFNGDVIFDQHFVPVAGGLSLQIAQRATVDIDDFAETDLRDLAPNGKTLFVGIGGGSDGLQAAQLALTSGLQDAVVVSVRSGIAGHDSPDLKTGQSRAVTSHGGEIAPGVFRVLPASRGSGRFLEHLPTDEIPVFLVHETPGLSLTAQFGAILQHVGNVSTVVAVDTGGDSLYPIAAMGAGHDVTRTTPDQDLRVLQAIEALGARHPGLDLRSVVLAVGVDSPDNAADVLQRAGAKWFCPHIEGMVEILERYKRWRDQMPNRWLGKTPLAWMAGLVQCHGLTVIEIPVDLVCSETNPWSPFVHVNRAMACGFLMPLAGHLAALRAHN